jgi:hypothetical protein
MRGEDFNHIPQRTQVCLPPAISEPAMMSPQRHLYYPNYLFIWFLNVTNNFVAITPLLL